MARTAGVWGIDIGNCALKALRCHFNREDGSIVADAFDYIEYPKILTQPDTEPGDMVHDALSQFLSRNNISGDKIAISVAGQNGLTRFIKLPPVESKRIPDLVKYEAKQQIPFDLKDVIWDYQRLGGDKQSDLALEIDIGLFAMKREQVYKSLEPYEEVRIPVDYVQLTPLTLYNLAMFDYLTDLPSPEEYDPENPPPSIAFLSMGTDDTDLVITNGFKVWQRNIPVGGNHFTKALTSEMKLTFAKAEHLKRNANASTDKKALFQAMRSVFSDFVDQIQRSLRYYISLDRYAKIDKIIGLGDPMHLAGLRKYLEQNLGITVEIADTFNRLNTTELENAPTFKENIPAFGVCYGLCMQGLNKATLTTNLLPKEIVVTRVINSKKPWMVAAVALMLLGITISYGAHYGHFVTSKNPEFSQWTSRAQSLTSQISSLQTQSEEEIKKFKEIQAVGNGLLSNAGRSLEWLELMRVISAALPQEADDAATQNTPIQRRNQVQIENLEAQPFTKVDLWKEYVTKAGYLKTNTVEPAAAEGAEGASENGEQSGDSSGTSDPAMSDSGAADSGGEGETSESNAAPKTWLVQITGYHYHNRIPEVDPAVAPEGANFIRERIIKPLQEGRIKLARPAIFDSWVEQQEELFNSSEAQENAGEEALPENAAPKFEVYQAPGDDKEGVWYTMEEMGVSYPVLIEVPELSVIKKETVTLYEEKTDEAVDNSGAINAGQAQPRVVPEDNKPKTVELCKYHFIVQFLWTPKEPLQREIDRQAKLKKEREEEIQRAKERAEAEAAAAAKAQDETAEQGEAEKQ